MTDPQPDDEQREKKVEAVDKFVLDWYEDVIHARHLDRIGQGAPEWLRAGWPDPLAPEPDEPAIDEDMVEDDVLLDEIEEIEWFD